MCRRGGKRYVTPCRCSLTCSKKKPEPGVRAVFGHWLFGYIHPYPDGNGRMARFLMNVMLASGGYPWTVVRVEDRDAYLAALDRASIDANIISFSKFLAERVRWSLKQGAKNGRETTRKNARRREREPIRKRA